MKRKIKSVGVNYLLPPFCLVTNSWLRKLIFIIIFINFKDTLVSSTHTLPVNIFNLKGGETMLARDNENFPTLGENRTRDPPNTIKIGRSNHCTRADNSLYPPCTATKGREFDSRPGYENFLFAF